MIERIFAALLARPMPARHRFTVLELDSASSADDRPIDALLRRELARFNA